MSSVTKDGLASAFVGLENTLAGIFNSFAQGSSKHRGSPSPFAPPVLEQDWVNVEIKAEAIEPEEGQVVNSISEQWEPV